MVDTRLSRGFEGVEKIDYSDPAEADEAHPRKSADQLRLTSGS
jgi:hypothetical protein